MITQVENQIQAGQRQVADYRDVARLELTAADAARARAQDTREWVIGQYWQALLLAAGWLGLPTPPVAHSDLIVARELSIADTAAAQTDIVLDKLRTIDHWLTTAPALPETTAAAPGAALALATSHPGAATGRLVTEPEPGHRGGVVPLRHDIPEPPREPRWLLIVATVAAIAIAYAAAVIAPTADTTTVAAAATHIAQQP